MNKIVSVILACSLFSSLSFGSSQDQEIYSSANRCDEAKIKVSRATTTENGQPVVWLYYEFCSQGDLNNCTRLGKRSYSTTELDKKSEALKGYAVDVGAIEAAFLIAGLYIGATEAAAVLIPTGEAAAATGGVGVATNFLTLGGMVFGAGGLAVGYSVVGGAEMILNQFIEKLDPVRNWRLAKLMGEDGRTSDADQLDPVKILDRDKYAKKAKCKGMVDIAKAINKILLSLN